MSISAGKFVVPDLVTSHFHLRPGDLVADFGAGSGFFLKPLTTAVGPEGKVYACEIQKQLVERLTELAHTLGLENVHPVWCDLEEANGIRIDSQTLDAAILVNTLFQIQDKSAGVTEMLRTLRTGGKFFVIDWTESFGSMGPTPDAVVARDAAVALLESHGCILETEFPAGEHHYGLHFKKV
jgi:ubiquinone/menaquinone biosynthesis C-methylase UbiE